MQGIASLGFRVDTSQAVSAISNINQMAAASMRMQQQIQQKRQIDKANRIIATYSTFRSTPPVKGRRDKQAEAQTD